MLNVKVVAPRSGNPMPGVAGLEQPACLPENGSTRLLRISSAPNALQAKRTIFFVVMKNWGIISRRLAACEANRTVGATPRTCIERRDVHPKGRHEILQ